MTVRTNADTPADARAARSLRRRRHRSLPHGAHVLRRRPHSGDARDDPCRERGGPPRCARKAACRCSGPISSHLFTIMHGLPVTIRLLDPPLHEFLPKIGRGDRRSGGGHGHGARRCCASASMRCTSSTRCSAIAAAGWRFPIPRSSRCRPAPSSRRRSTRRARRAPPSCRRSWCRWSASARSSTTSRRASTRWPPAVIAEAEMKIDYLVGTMIELPRAALRAHDHRRGTPSSSPSAPTI